MSVVYDWVKNLVFFYIWITAVLHLLPKSNYQKYVRFFGGLLLVVLLISPLLELLYHPEYLLEKISYESFWQEMDTIQLDMEGMEEMQQQAYLEKYQEAIGQDIMLMVEEQEMTVQRVEVDLTEDYQLEHIALEVRLVQQQGISIEKMVLEDNSQEYPMVMKLRKKIMEFYQVTDSQIQVMVQEG